MKRLNGSALVLFAAVSMACDATEPPPDESSLSVSTSALSIDAPAQGEASDPTEIRVFIPLPSTAQRPPARLLARVLVAEQAIEEVELLPPFTLRGNLVLVTVPRSFDTLDATIELVAVAEDGTQTISSRSMPAGAAAALRQAAPRFSEAVAPERNTSQSQKPLATSTEVSQ